MPTYPNEIYVRAIDDTGNPLPNFIQAKFLTTNHGDYIYNPNNEKFNIFIKDQPA
jgi:hypothetical protein